jgi:hypothetical protein
MGSPREVRSHFRRHSSARWAWLSWPRGSLHVNQFSPLTEAGDIWFGRDILCAGG